MLSSAVDSGNTPAVGHSPTVVLWPKVPQNAAGRRTEPPVSEPIAKPQRPAATATAGPLLEPPGIRCTRVSQGFQGVPQGVLMPTAPSANSTVLTLPRSTQPARRSALTNGPSGPTRSATSSLEPAVVGMPSTAKMSLIATGTPINGPRSVPAASRRSMARAWASAGPAATC